MRKILVINSDDYCSQDTLSRTVPQLFEEVSETEYQALRWFLSRTDDDYSIIELLPPKTSIFENLNLSQITEKYNIEMEKQRDLLLKKNAGKIEAERKRKQKQLEKLKEELGEK
jgi:hypothetical protein